MKYMPFITQGKTNWKFLLIVAILATIVGGGILLYVAKQQIPINQSPEIKKLEKKIEQNNMEEIIEKEDTCKDMQDSDKRDECYFKLALDTENEYYCKRLNSWYGLISSRNCFGCLAASKNNLSLCSENEFCPQYVFLQNTELCSDIEIDMITRCRSCYLDDLTGSSCKLEDSKIDRKEECIKNFAIETEDFELCKKIDGKKTGSLRFCQEELAIKLNMSDECASSYCINKIAINTNNAELCESEDCILTLALSSNNPSLCQKFSGSELEKCYQKFGLEIGKKGNCELCDEITNAISKRYCMLEVTIVTEDYKSCEGLDINIEDLFKKYTDEEFGFSFYYPIDDKIETSEDKIFIKRGIEGWTDITIEKKQIEGKYLFDYFYPAGPVPPPWTSYIYYDESIKKYVKYAYHVDEGSEQSFENDMNFWREVTNREAAVKDGKQVETEMPPSGHILMEPGFYTVSNLSVFGQGVRFGHYNIACLYPNRFLYISVELTGTSVNILDAFTKTIVRIDQNIENKRLRKVLIEEFFSRQPYLLY